MATDDRSLADFMPNAAPPGEAAVAHAGAPLPAGSTPATRDAIIAGLRTVFDPEIPVNIYDLGLIYEVRETTDGAVWVEMTLTAPNCPVAGLIPRQVADAVAAVDGVGEVEVRLVWEPPWTKDRMSEEALLALDML